MAQQSLVLVKRMYIADTDQGECAATLRVDFDLAAALLFHRIKSR